jgi:hypothetical protein
MTDAERYSALLLRQRVTAHLEALPPLLHRVEGLAELPRALALVAVRAVVSPTARLDRPGRRP